MEGESSAKRLDEILLEKGLITEEQIRQALLSQREEGGKLGSHLVRHGNIDEAGLVDALSTQMNCPGVVLGSLKIPRSVIEMVPKDIALARKVMPFEYDADQNILKIACEDPADENLAGELGFVSSGASVELHVAAQVALDAAISKYYLGMDVEAYDNLRPAVLLVSDEEQVHAVKSLLEVYDYEVALTDSVDNVVDILEDKRFHSVFIRNSLLGDGSDLIDRVRRLSPTTLLRCYDNISALFFSVDPAVEGDLFLKNIDLLTSLLSSKAQLPVNHSIRVARLVDELCRRMKLPDGDRLTITNAAYLHDLATSYYGADDLEDHRKAIELTVTLLESLKYSQAVLNVLRSMYADLPGDHATRLPLEVLGGSILTAVDMACQATPANQHLSLDKFDLIKKSLRANADVSLLSEVVEQLIDMLQGRILNSHSAQASAQIMMYSDNADTQKLLSTRLRNEGFRTIVQSSVESAIDLYHRSRPDIIILAIAGDCGAVYHVIDEMTNRGVALESAPTLLLTDGLPVSDIINLLSRGLEDVILLDPNLDLLVGKIHTLVSIREPEAPELSTPELSAPELPAPDRANEEGCTTPEPPAEQPVPRTQGRLSDINLVDLIQIFGPGRRTAKVTVHTEGPDAKTLMLYLDQGHITCANTESNTGAEAVYEALRWADGTWTIETVEPGDLPEPNNDLSNESILMEGCRALDEELEKASGEEPEKTSNEEPEKAPDEELEIVPVW
jgi:DNA-binding response OmpR family regulator